MFSGRVRVSFLGGGGDQTWREKEIVYTDIREIGNALVKKIGEVHGKEDGEAKRFSRESVCYNNRVQEVADKKRGVAEGLACRALGEYYDKEWDTLRTSYSAQSVPSSAKPRPHNTARSHSIRCESMPAAKQGRAGGKRQGKAQ